MSSGHKNQTAQLYLLLEKWIIAEIHRHSVKTSLEPAINVSRSRRLGHVEGTRYQPSSYASKT
jgi:hypothetical protein